MKHILLIFVMAFFSCYDATQTSGSGVKDSTISDTHSFADTLPQHINILVSDFKNIPKEIEGCSGLFRRNNTDTLGYVFAMDFGTKAFIEINGSMVMLTLKEKKGSENMVQNRYTGSGYEVELHAAQSKVLGEELTEYKGSLLISKNGEEIIITVTGEIGC